jgi:hypothetical protein
MTNNTVENQPHHISRMNQNQVSNAEGHTQTLHKIIPGISVRKIEH